VEEVRAVAKACYWGNAQRRACQVVSDVGGASFQLAPGYMGTLETCPHKSGLDAGFMNNQQHLKGSGPLFAAVSHKSA
jgi:hypothetical protein